MRATAVFAAALLATSSAIPLEQVVDPNDQTGGEVKDVTTQKTTSTDEPVAKVQEAPLVQPDLPFNLPNMHFPVANDGAVLSHVSSEDLVAPPPQIDPLQQDVHGVTPEVVDL